MKKIVYIDMDNTLCDFLKYQTKMLIENPKQIYPQSQWGFFLKLEPLEDAIESFNLLKEHLMFGY